MDGRRCRSAYPDHHDAERNKRPSHQTPRHLRLRCGQSRVFRPDRQCNVETARVANRPERSEPTRPAMTPRGACLRLLARYLDGRPPGGLFGGLAGFCVPVG
jgi:hypothetical protein